MIALSQRAWSAAPLLLALTALAVRLAAPSSAPPSTPTAPAQEFTPPLAFALASRASGVDELWEVDSEASHAQLVLDSDAAPTTYDVSGTLRIDADESIGGAELVLTPTGAGPLRPQSLRLHVAAGSTRTSPVPGVHAARPALRLVSDEGSQPATLELTWLRLPGQRVLVDAVTAPALALDRIVRPARARSPWEREPQAVLSMRLSLGSARTSR